MILAKLSLQHQFPYKHILCDSAVMCPILLTEMAFILILDLDKVPTDLPPDTTLLDLQNNKITEIKDGDFKNLKDLHVRMF